MLTPKQLDDLPDPLVELYAQAEADILADMARRISTYNFFIPAAQWQYEKLKEMGAVEAAILRRLSELTGRTQKEMESLMKQAGMQSLERDDKIYRAAGLSPTPLSASPALQEVLRAGLSNTNGLFENLTRTTANTATHQFEQALDRAYMQIITGGFDANAAIRSAVKDLASQGVASISYASGRVDHMDVAVRRAVLTGVNQTSLRLQDTLAEELESDLVETTAHEGARPSHALWQGKIFSRSGGHPKYPDFRSSTGYGTGAGLGGWNCRHSFFPYFEGISEPAYTRRELEELQAKKYTYNGQRLTEYEASQQQRGIERQIRRWKREYAAMEAAGQDTTEAAAKIRQWQDRQKNFLKQTGLKRQTDREQVPGFGKSQAAKASYQVKKLSKKKKDGIIEPKLSEIVKKQNWVQKIALQDRAELYQITERATEWEARFWNKNGNLLKGDFYKPNTGYYSPRQKRIHLDLNQTDDRCKRVGLGKDYRTFFHEAGHLFDHQVLRQPGVRLSDRMPDMRSKLESDFIRHANLVLSKQNIQPIKSVARLTDAQKKALRMDLWDDVHLKNAISDITEGLTNTRVFGGYGHGKKYWTHPASLERETFAHMFEAKTIKGERLAVMQEYFPDTYAYFERIFEEMGV